MKINKLNEAFNDSEFENRVRSRYRKLTGMEEGIKIVAEDIEDWAVDNIAVKSNIDRDRTRKILSEDDESDDVTIDAHNKKVASEINAVAQLDENDSKGVIEHTLDRLLKVNRLNNKRGHNHFNNVLFEGNAGTGKTSRVVAWAQENGVNLILKKANELDVSDFGVVTHNQKDDVGKKVRTTEFDALDKPNSVLFLDEFNRAPANVRATMLTLVADHKIMDPQGENGVKYFPNFLFTIAAINPNGGLYDTKELDPAEMSRFKHVHVPNEPHVLLSHFTKIYNKWIEESEAEGDYETAKEDRGRLGILTKLLSDSNFRFDDPEDEETVMYDGNKLPLNSRSLESLISECDGTKEDFLNLWNSYVNNLKKPMAQTILKNYKDIDDKANQAIGVGAKKGKSAFAGRKSLLDIINDKLDEE